MFMIWEKRYSEKFILLIVLLKQKCRDVEWAAKLIVWVELEIQEVSD